MRVNRNWGEGGGKRAGGRWGCCELAHGCGARMPRALKNDKKRFAHLALAAPAPPRRRARPAAVQSCESARALVDRLTEESARVRADVTRMRRELRQKEEVGLRQSRVIPFVLAQHVAMEGGAEKSARTQRPACVI